MKTLIAFSRECQAFSVSKAIQVLGVSVVALLFSLPISAQLNYGRIYGGITDQNGAVLVGATVTVTDVARGDSRSLITGSDGQFSAPSLLPGTYQVRAQVTGFEVAQRTDVVVEVGQDVRVDLTLLPGEQTQTVTVSGQAAEINTSNAQLGGDLESKTLDAMPLQGRVYNRLLEFKPGIQAAAGDQTPTFSSEGNKADAQVWLLDGVEDLNIYDATGPVIGTTSQLNYLTILPMDAIQEVNIIENPKAEYGWKSGAQVNVGLKSGTNSVHGTAYGLFRNNALDAKNPFLTSAVPKATDDFYQYGASIGGPIKKDKLFYFTNYEGFQFTVGSPQFVQIPSSVGGGTASNSFPAAIAAMNALHEPISQLSLNLAGCSSAGVCAPTSGVFNNGGVASSVPIAINNVGKSNNVIGKIDYNFNSHNSFNGDYFFGQSTDLQANGIHEYWDLGNYDRDQAVRGVWVWLPSSSWVNEARFGYDREGYRAYPAECTQNLGQPDYATEFGLVSGAGLYIPDCGFPGVTISGFTGLGAAVGTTGASGGQISTFGTYSAIDSVSYTRGKHQFKFGGEVHFARYTGVGSPVNDLGNANFGTGGVAAFTGATALESFLAGVPSTGTVLVGESPWNINQTEYAGFFQDDYRITPRITVNAGVRYEYQTPIKERNNLFGNFNPSAPAGLVQQSSGGSVYTVSEHDFSPRLGIVWDVNGKGTTVVRTGGSILYNLALPYTVLISSDGASLGQVPTGFSLYQPNGTITSAGGNIRQGTASLSTTQIPWAVNTPIFNVGPSALACGNSLGQANPNLPTGPANPANPAPCNLAVMDLHLPTAYVSEWTLGIQHAFTNTLSMDLAYVGNHGAHEGAMIDVNQPTPGAANGKTSPTNAAELIRRPFYSQFPYFAQIRTYRPALESNYNALEATLTQRLSHGLSAEASYTWSHALDEFSTENSAVVMDSRDPHLDYGNSNIISPQHFTLIATYVIPGAKSPAQLLQGWKLNSTVNLDSALPFNAVDTTSDISGTGEGADRWTLAGTSTGFKAGGRFALPCYGAAGSSFASTSNCVTGLPAACVAAAAAEPNGPGGTTGTASLDKLGCYMEGGDVIVPPAQGTYGSMARDILTNSKDLRNWDVSLTKDSQIKERLTVQFKAEVFNVLNHTLYAAPSANPDTPATFGQSQSTPNNPRNPVFGTDGPRQMQLGLRLMF
jgi:hypothetical protein